MKLLYKRILEIVRKKRGEQKGIALIVTLLVMLVLVLLALSIAMQSQTEYVIAVNEQDSIAALSHGESGLQWVNREVINFVAGGPVNLTPILDGADDTPLTADDLLPELTGLTLSTVIDVDNLTEANERTTSTVESLDWDGPSGTAFGPLAFEAFRLGQDTTGDNVWDGPRAVVYLRLMDNYDGGTNPLVDDTDNRMRVLVAVDYPVFVDADGNKLDDSRAPRGTARRKLIGRFAPGGNVAIRTDGDLEISGSLEVCGECGGVHANETITIAGSGDLVTCGEATGTTGIDASSSTAQIRGGAGLTGRVFIPVINPYDDLYVPPPSLFDTNADTSLPDHLRCPAPGVALNTDNDPGATKYFSLVIRTVNGQKQFQIYKAYWDSANAHWVWRLIDDSTEASGLDVELDNCGRVVSGTVAGVNISDPGAGVGVNDGGTNEFYNFAPSNGQGGNYDLENPVCAADDSLTGVTRNDFNPNNYWRIPDGSDPWAGGDNVLDPSEYTTKSVAATSHADPVNDPPLPGNVRTYLNVNATPNSNPVTDSIADFDYTKAIATGNGGSSRGEITNGNGQNVFSPLWGSVLFVYGNMTANGGGTLNYVDSGGSQATMDLEDIVATGDGRWKVSFIVFNSMRFTGNPVWGTFGNSFPVTAVAGRDIEMGGTGQVPGSQDQCPSMAPGSDCTATPPQAAGYSGMLLAHEEVHFTGNVQLDGFIIAEDAGACSDTQSDESMATGSVQIHYDCTNPANLWGDQSARLVSWEEVQVTNPDYD